MQEKYANQLCDSKVGRKQIVANHLISGSSSRGLTACRWAFVCLILLVSVANAYADDVSDIAKKVQNPISDLISLPFEHTLNLDVGPDEEIQHIFNAAPIFPIKLSEGWLLVNRAIIPVIDMPLLALGVGDEFGLGDINYTPFLSPREAGGNTFWGIGPSITFPTASEPILGTEKLLLGPSFLVMKESPPWSLGFLISNSWSVGGEEDRADVNAGFVQPWLYYNFPSGAYIFYEPVITVDWEAESDEQWTVPLGVGVGKIFTIGSQYMNMQITAFNNIERPTGTAEWSVRYQIQFLFPK